MKKKLNILWTNADPITSKLMVMMYCSNSIPQKWWDEVDIIIWGATAKFVAENKEIQSAIYNAQRTGVKFYACEACAIELGVKDKLVALDINVKYMGQPLTEIIQSDEHLVII